METLEKKETILKIKIISKDDSAKIWNLKNLPPDIYFFDNKESIKEIEEKKDDDDCFIIYLSGISIKEQIKGLQETKNKKLWIHSSKLFQEDFLSKDQAGYYLIKIRRSELSSYHPEEQEFLNLMPSGWRSANIREASEILSSIFFIYQEKKYIEEYHICLRGETVNIARMAKKKDNLVLESRYKEDPLNNIWKKLNSITIKSS